MAEEKPKVDPAVAKTKARMLRETNKIGEAAEVLSGKKPISGTLGKGIKAAQNQGWDSFLNDAETEFAKLKGEKPQPKQIKIRKLK